MGRGNVEVEVNPIEESMILHCQERLSKNQFDLTVRKDERFLQTLFHLFLGLRASNLSNYHQVKLRNRKSRLEKNQFDLTVRKDERFLLDLHLTVSQFHCLRPCAIALPGVALACKRSAIGGNK